MDSNGQFNEVKVVNSGNIESQADHEPGSVYAGMWYTQVSGHQAGGCEWVDGDFSHRGICM